MSCNHYKNNNIYIYIYIYVNYFPDLLSRTYVVLVAFYMLFSTLQFNLSTGIVGVIYMCIILMYTLGTLLAGQLTERLVRVYNK